MNKEEFIGKLQMVYIGDRNAFNDIVCAYDGLLYRVDKAIEYIKKELFIIEELDEKYVDDLLNILKGEDKQ